MAEKPTFKNGLGREINPRMWVYEFKLAEVK